MRSAGDEGKDPAQSRARLGGKLCDPLGFGMPQGAVFFSSELAQADNLDPRIRASRETSVL